MFRNIGFNKDLAVSIRYMLVRHKVADFARWKMICDSRKETQEKDGLKLEYPHESRHGF